MTKITHQHRRSYPDHDREFPGLDLTAKIYCCVRFGLAEGVEYWPMCLCTVEWWDESRGPVGPGISVRRDGRVEARDELR
jgi:hypothetical protein